MENLFSLWLKLTLKSERRFFAHMFCLLSLERVCVCVCVCWVYAGMTKINQKSPTPTLFFFLLNDVYTLLLRPSDIIYHYLSSMKNERKCEVKKYLETRNQFSQLKIQSTSWQFFLTVCQISHVGKILMITLFFNLFVSISRFIVENIYNFPSRWIFFFFCRLWIQMQTPPPITSNNSLYDSLCLMFLKKRNLCWRGGWFGDSIFTFFYKETFYNKKNNLYTHAKRRCLCNEYMWMGKLKYYSQHHVLMKGGKFMGAYFYSIILFVFSALSLSHFT